MVTGDGFHFVAPADWTVVRKGASVAAVNGDVSRVEVVRFTLEKPYRPALFAAAARELDGVAARLASQLSGNVSSRATSEVGGRKARSYTIDYGPGKTQEISQPCSAGGTTISFKLVFNAKGKLVQYWMEKRPTGP